MNNRELTRTIIYAIEDATPTNYSKGERRLSATLNKGGLRKLAAVSIITVALVVGLLVVVN